MAYSKTELPWKAARTPGRHAPGGAWRGPRIAAKLGRCELVIVTFTDEERTRFEERRGDRYFWTVKHQGAVRRGGPDNGATKGIETAKVRAIAEAQVLPACGISRSADALLTKIAAEGGVRGSRRKKSRRRK